VQQIVTHEIPQDKTSLVGNDDRLGAIDTGKLNVTYHHDAFTLLRQRTPRMRFGNAHVFNIFVDDTLSAPFPGTQTAVNSTTSAAVLVENSDFLEVRTPLMFSNGGRITQRGSAWTFGGVPTPFDPARLNPVDPDALVFNPPSQFTWTDLTRLPYAYTLDPVDFVRNHLSQVGTIVPVDITIFEDRTFTFVLKTPPTPVLLRQAAGLDKGSQRPGKDVAGSVTMAQVEEIAKTKMPDLNANDIEAAKLQVAGTARSMGLQVRD
jgi:ribosomal protein L11